MDASSASLSKVGPDSLFEQTGRDGGVDVSSAALSLPRAMPQMQCRLDCSRGAGESGGGYFSGGIRNERVLKL